MKKTFISALSAIASLAIVKTVLDYFKFDTSWFAFLVTAIIVGIVTFLLPLLVEKVRFAYSIISTGFTVLLMIPLADLNSTQRYWFIFILITVVALVTDIVVSVKNHYFYFTNIIFDMLLCLLANHIIAIFNNAIITLIALFILYAIILLVNFTFRFSIKRKNNVKKSTDTPTGDNQKSNIDIPVGKKRDSIDIPIE